MGGCCRVVHSHGMLRLSTQELMPLGAVGVFGCVGGCSTVTWCNTGLTGMTVYSFEGRYVWQLWLKSGFGMVLTGRVEMGTCCSLVRRVHAAPWMGWRVCVGYSSVTHSLKGGKNPVPTKMDASY